MENFFAILRVMGQIVGALTLVGGVLAALAGFAYLLFKRFATNWLDNRFKKELADYTHKHNQEIERLRFQINATLDRTTKLHSQEFEILPHIWGLVTMAISHVDDSLTVYFMPHDVTTLQPERLEAILRADNYSEADIAAIQAARPETLNDVYGAARIQHVSRIGTEAYAAFTNYYLSKSIMLDPALRDLLAEMSVVMGRATTHDLADVQAARSTAHYMAQKQRAYAPEAERIRDAIRDRMFARLTDTQGPVIGV